MFVRLTLGLEHGARVWPASQRSRAWLQKKNSDELGQGSEASALLV